MSDAAAIDAKVDEAPIKIEGQSKLLPMMLVLNTLLLGGVLAAVVLGVGRSPAPAADAKKEGAEGEHGKPAEGEHDKPAEGGAAADAPAATVRLADFVIHLRNPDVDRFARFSFEIEVGSEADKTSITNSTARIRDQFIGYLSDRTVEELRGSEGLTATKKELIARVKEAVPHARVRGLYVTDFVLQ